MKHWTWGMLLVLAAVDRLERSSDPLELANLIYPDCWEEAIVDVVRP